MEQPLILVTGATGTVGSELVKQLIEGGHRVRALARNPAKAKELADGADIVVADLAQPQTLGPAFVNVDKVFVATNGVDIAALEANAFEAARSAGVKHVVKLSGRHLDAVFMQGAPLARLHTESERRLRALGLSWTIIRPGLFASNFLMWVDREKGVVALPVGDGVDTPTDPRDVAAVACLALTTPGHEGKIHEVTGPEYLSYAEMARKIGVAIGRPVALVDMPKSTVRDGLVASGVPGTQADGLLRYFDGVKSGQIFPPTSTIEDLLGRPPRSFDCWLADNVARLRG